MNDVELVESLVDSLDTGLPNRPDLTPVRSAGTRQRRRRRLGWTAGACAAAGALVVPALLLVGPGGTAPSVAPDVAADPGQAISSAPPPVSPDELAGPEFGTGMRTAVEQALPGVTFRSEQLGDGWRFSDHYGAYDWTVHDPVQWETLFTWSQLFGLPDGVTLNVVASRTAPTASGFGSPGATECNQAHYPSRRNCQAFDVGAQRVVVNDGIQYDDPARWYRDVDVFYFDETRGMAAHVSVSAYTAASTWEEARDALPSAEDLTGLGLQGALVLPAPDHYPVPEDLEDHMTSTP
jgi:hypothetical protein